MTALTHTYPLAHRDGVTMLHLVLAATEVWKALTRPQRELLLSCVAGSPIKARVDVYGRLTVLGLLDGNYAPTGRGRAVVRWRLP
jgi:hypothetical protein